jgi:hypothetical protein
MDLPPLHEALPWLDRQADRTVGTRLHPRDCLFSVWLRDILRAQEVYVDDQVTRVQWWYGYTGVQAAINPDDPLPSA